MAARFLLSRNMGVYTTKRIRGNTTLLLRRLMSTAQTPLVDSFNRHHNYLRISLTEKCSLRCQYCMPDEGVQLSPKHNLLTTDEIIGLVKLFSSVGVNKVRLTGGEPLVRKDCVDIVKRISEIDSINKIGLTTNGLVLTKHLPKLIDAGMTHVNISLDTLIAAKFEFITRRRGIHKVLEAIDSAAEKVPTKINVVVMKNFNEDEIVDFVKLTQDKGIQVRFIEYMPFDGNKWNWSKVVSLAEILDIVRKQYPAVQELPPEQNHTAKMFCVPGFKGSFGVISSMSKHFCGSCNRLRLTADGSLRSCLFSQTADELSLRDLLRSDVQDSVVIHNIREHLLKKHFKHGGHMDVNKLVDSQNRPMIKIGG